MKYVKLILAFLLVTCILTQEVNLDKEIYDAFDAFLEKYQKQYTSQEEKDNRFNVFKNNYIETHQTNGNIQGVLEDDDNMKVGVTQFSDMTKEEFQAKILNLDMANFPKPTSANKKFLEIEEERTLQSITIPSAWDWRLYGAVTSVKFQGTCGACWSFTAAAVIEGQYAIKYKQLMNFSVQQMLDCSYGDSGCQGGIMHSAFDYVSRAGGLQTEASYSYIGYKSTCRFNPALSVARVTSYEFAPSTDETQIMAFLYSRGPLGITMNANNLQFYQGGVISVPYYNCPYAPNHGVNIVGYGNTPAGTPYWIIKNTWGTSWGEGGYFRIVRNIGLCGVNQYVITANLA
jgi:cathepsin F